MSFPLGTQQVIAATIVPLTWYLECKILPARSKEKHILTLWVYTALGEGEGCDFHVRIN